MQKSFRGFIKFNDNDYKEIWDNALFVIDTNVLLNFFRYKTKEATKSFYELLKKLKDLGRLWFPHQVILEYYFNYKKNFDKQNEGYQELLTKSQKALSEFSKELEAIKNLHPYLNFEKFVSIEENQNECIKSLKQKYDEEILNLPDSNYIYDQLNNLFADIVGETFEQQKIEQIQKEGEERYKLQIPPGFEDDVKDKDPEIRCFGSIRYKRKYGDLIIWEQIIEKAIKDKKPIIFVTEEKKEDWWEKYKGKTVGPHPLLIQEFYERTKQLFYMYKTDTFINYVKSYTKISITLEDIKLISDEIKRFNDNDSKSIIIKNNITAYLKSEYRRKNLSKLFYFKSKFMQSHCLEKYSFLTNYDTLLEELCINLENEYKNILTQFKDINDINNYEYLLVLYNKLPNDKLERILELDDILEKLGQ